MSWEAWFTLAVVAATIVVLVKDLLPPAAAFLGAMVAVLAAEIITPAQAFSGFANPAPITIAALYIIARAVEKTGALTPLIARILGGAGGTRAALTRMVAPVAGASAFMNNTPVVSMLVPQIEKWAETRGRSPSDYLMPLSFAAILGGVVTVIGTATNLVVSGLMEAAGQEPIGFFEITKAGLPIAVAGIAVIVLLSPVVLPSRRSVRREIAEELRQFVGEMTVTVGGPLDGRSVDEGGLRHLQRVFLVQLERDGDVAAPVTPDTVLRGGDRLRFVGQSDQMAELQAIRGLNAAEEELMIDIGPGRNAYFEAVVGASSPLVGQTLRGSGFRGTFQAAVVAIHRAGQLVDAKLGSVRLRVGDTLLVLADPGFRDRWSNSNHFLLIAPLDVTPPAGTRQALLLPLVLAGVAVLAATGITPLVTAVLLGAVVLVVLRVLTPREAQNAVNLDVVVMIAAALGLAQAMRVSGLAGEVADGLVEMFDGLGSRGLLLGVVLATVLLTEFVTNTAAALLLFPIAVSAAAAFGLDPRGFGIGVALAASSFLTPIGYQTNTMVYGPGGYRFTDYMRLGGPITVLNVVLILVLVPVFWPLGG